jgi:hypothetical protein
MKYEKERKFMKTRQLVGLPFVGLFLIVAPTALAASNTWYVDGLSGSDTNNCLAALTACKTIGHAISLAASGDFIMVAAATYTENLTIGISMEVIGSGATATIIDGGGITTVVKISNASSHVTLSGLTIRNGNAPVEGGGIFNLGTLTLVNSNVSGNRVGSGCSGPSFCSVLGGGIYNSGGTLTINNSTISGNTASPSAASSFPYGGGIANNRGTLTINNSTISGNIASHPIGHGGIAYGAGIANLVGTVTINNSTVSGNNASPFGDPFGLGLSYGGGISNGGTMTISNATISGNSATHGGGISGTTAPQNSVVADNPRGGNCHGTMTSKGHNLSSDATCSFSGSGDLNNTDPRLGTLGYYGGPTQTIPLLSGSPAIDAGNPSGCTDGQGRLLTTDQRGMPRPDREDSVGCDIGAYESQSDQP